MPRSDVDVPEGARAVAVLLHPHPDMGGDRHNHVVGSLFRGLPRSGIGALRFDFVSADLDRAAAHTVEVLDEAAAAAPGRPVVLVGYSFGAMVALRVTDERLAGWFLVAPPLGHVDAAAVGADPRPKGIAAPEHDFTPPATVAELTADWAAVTTWTVPGADHFLGAAAAEVVERVRAWIDEVV